MKIAVITNPNISNTEQVLDKLAGELAKRGLDYSVIHIDNLSHGFDFVCVIGGDGSILKAARFFAEKQIPVLGINLGRLGFLSQSNESEIEKVVEAIANKNYKTQDRIMLQSGKWIALNDFVIKGCSCTRTSRFALHINNKFVCDYVADGLIVSTPTGSTAYGLSAGGPILYPDINCLVIVPICPHTLNARPLVVPADEKIVISTMDELLTVSIDGQERADDISQIEIETSKEKARLAFLGDDDFYSILRNKLHWGISPVAKQ